MLTATSRLLVAVLLAATLSSHANAAPPNFVAAWSASAHGPYPVGNATAQPDLKFAFPNPARVPATSRSA